MAKTLLKKTDDVPKYIPPKPYFFFMVGDKYYYRLSPIPYAYKKPDFNEVKKKIAELNK